MAENGTLKAQINGHPWKKSMWSLARNTGANHDETCIPNGVHTPRPMMNGVKKKTEPFDYNTPNGHSTSPVQNPLPSTDQHKPAPHVNGNPIDMDANACEPLAIVGMAYKFPSGAENDERFWDMLVSAQCASKEFPEDRMNIDAFFNEDAAKSGAIHTRKAHFVDGDIRAFDATHFGISASDASAMDPNQRGLMETAYHALENAGISLSSISGSNTSVHVGFFSSDHTTFNLRDPLNIPKYYATGSSSAILSNRLSWYFNLRGPSMTIDTACSSGLIAMDLACQGLWAGSSDIALVGAANLILSPELNIALCNMNFLSPEGRCFSFDHRASGYARGEGFTVLVLKKLSKAQADGDTIRALVRGIATNHDGRTNGGITQPSAEMQIQLIHEAYSRFNLDLGATRFFEAHGTGTLVGDPTEAQAIGETFRRYRTDDEPLYVGAVKSNIGHLEGSSGLAGIVKAVLCVEKGIIPPNTNFEKLSPKIDAKLNRLNFPQQCIPWPDDKVRRASINSFGFGGANAHAIIEGVHQQSRRAEKYLNGHVNGEVAAPNPSSDADVYPKLVVLSSSDEAAITRQIDAHADYLSTLEQAEVERILPSYSYTTVTRRTRLLWRCFGVISSPTDLPRFKSLMSSPIKSALKTQKLGFLFTGQGAQWPSMGRELLSEPVFSNSIQQSQLSLNKLGCSWNIAESLGQTDAALLENPEFSQVLTTAIQLAIVDLVYALAFKPSTVVGHSSGEIAAAYAAGLISHESAIRVSYYRGVLASKLEANCETRCSMAAIGLSSEQASLAIKELEQDASSGVESGALSVSCINSPLNVTISGPSTQIRLLVESMKSKNIFARELRVGLGYHSSQMALISDQYLAHLSGLQPPRTRRIDWPVMVSSVTNDVLTARRACSAEYWVQNMVSPVNFLGAVRTAQVPQNSQLPVDGWFEIGPHSALRGPVREIEESISNGSKTIYTSALIRNKSALSTIMDAIGKLHCSSYELDVSRAVVLGLSASYRNKLKVLSDLPKYSFSRAKLFWNESQANKNFRFRKYGSHDLLGTRSTDPNALESQWRFIIKENDMPWILDHKVEGAPLYPAAGMIVMAIEAAKQLYDDQIPIAFELENVEFPAAITLGNASEGVEVRIHMSTNAKNGNLEPGHKFRIFLFKADNSHEVVCSGTIRGDYGRNKDNFDDATGKSCAQSAADVVSAACTDRIETTKMYDLVRELAGLDYGVTFQALDDFRTHNSGKAVARVLPRPDDSTTCHIVHPTRLDGVFQLCFAVLYSCGQIKTMVPTFVSKLRIAYSGFGHHGQPPLQASASLKDISSRVATVDMTVSDVEDGTLRAEVHGLKVTAVASGADPITTLADAPYTCSFLEWKPDLSTLSYAAVQEHCDAAKPNREEPVDYFQKMDALAFQYGARALRKIDEDGGRVAPGMERYTMWLRGHIESSSSIPLMSDEELDNLCASVARTARADLYIPVGKSLPDFLQGKQDPLEAIFADEALVTAFYRDLMDDTTGIYSFNCYLDAIVHKNPGLKFLEVGAGTGSSTSALLRVIGASGTGPRFESYTYTDISPSFFEQARSKFSEQANRLEYRVLNVEHDISSQGYEAGAYDMVIADNVLHATHDLKVTLNNIRKLLRPGGKLILKELATPGRLLTGFAFGLLPGWWLGKEPERQSSPLLTEEGWEKIMKATGFSGIEQQFVDHADPVAHIWTIMVSTAIESDDVESEKKEKKKVPLLFVLDTESPSQREAALELSQQLHHKATPNLHSLSEASKMCENEPNTYQIIYLEELGGPVLFDINFANFECLQKLLSHASSTIWIKKSANGSTYASPEYGMGDGLCRVTRHENHNLVVSVCVETDGLSSMHNIASVCRMAQKSLIGECANLELEYQESKGILQIGRLVRAKKLDEHVFKRTAGPVVQEPIVEKRLEVGIRTRGLLDTIHFVEESVPAAGPASEEVDVAVRAIGLNYKDCLTLLGKFDSDLFGSECAGVVTAVGVNVTHVNPGDRVLVAAHHVFKTHVRVPSTRVFKVMDSMSFAEAASLSTNFCTAYYSLVKLARLHPGDKILIHSAAGGTGQAMIQLARLAGAEIYATVGSKFKRDFLVNEYNIPSERIFYSRDESFVDGIMKATNGRGVDVLINSQQGRLLEVSWDCIAIGGRFIDIGLKDAYLRNHLPMHVFQRNVSFSGVNLNAIMIDQLDVAVDILNGVLTLFREGKLKPAAPLHLYPFQDIEKALRFLQSGKSTGKVILELDQQAVVPISQGPHSDYRFPSDATYVIAGGLGGLGRQIARWLTDRGVKHLLLLSRSPEKPSAVKLIEELRQRGVNIQSPKCDISDVHALRETLSACQTTMPKIRGCIQAAMVLRDSNFRNMSFDHWKQAILPKVQGSWNLHQELPSTMDFMVLLSSCAGIMGNAGQSNYCAGNTYQDALARYRTSLGRKTIAIDLGIVLGEGFVAENDAVMESLIRLKLFRPNTVDEITSMLDYYCDPALGQIDVLQSQVVTGFELPANITANGDDMPTALEQPIFRCMHQAEGHPNQTRSSDGVKSVSLRTAIIGADTPTDAGLVVTELLIEKLSRVLGLPVKDFSMDSSLDSYGVDSLVGVELRNWLAKESGADLAVFEILGGASLTEIGGLVASRSPLRNGA